MHKVVYEIKRALLFILTTKEATDMSACAKQAPITTYTLAIKIG
ncbi:hypothetical protein PCIT_a0288 [Pseudoalteromonas citrea]|uniref:Uncharacterized protein n=1 Tax=Pseudoalteromonas citrea TaxID=43655 RepID=A0AAD4AKQ4_9GAMM|nr:hypothetical protein PCIT_a0288 [Pseudoalteromonas citrea]